MIYNFLDESKKGLIVNFFITLTPNSKFISYRELSKYMLGNFKEFKIGFDGNIIDILISEDSHIFIEMDGKSPLTGAYHHHFNVYLEKTKKNLKDFLIQNIRDHKLNTILK